MAEIRTVDPAAAQRHIDAAAAYPTHFATEMPGYATAGSGRDLRVQDLRLGQSQIPSCPGGHVRRNTTATQDAWTR